MNHIIISGRLGRDAERKQVGSSEKLRFSVAVSEKYKDRSGELIEKTHWIDVDVFGEKWIDFIAPRLTKGTEVCVTGEIRVNKSDDGRVWTTVFAREILVGAPPKRRDEEDDPFAAPPKRRAGDPAEDWDR